VRTPQPTSVTAKLVTVSVDDGHPTDLYTAELLSKYRLAATFYIPRRNPEREVLSLPKIRALAQQFEIGSHTISHVSLNSVTTARAWTEIRDGKEWLEEVVGRGVISFCYPRGKFNRHLVSMVRNAGFLGARTCRQNLHSLRQYRFTCGVSTQAWCHSRTIQLRHAFLEGNLSGAINFVRVYKGATDWQTHFLYALDYVELHGGVAHLSLHSWEIDAHDEWLKLEAVLRGVAEREALVPITNGSLFELWKFQDAQLGVADSLPVPDGFKRTIYSTLDRQASSSPAIDPRNEA
jgi:peptidoglycan-N-acetylglucosamine deacetylase